MELKTAIEILEYYQRWRLGEKDDIPHDSKKITEAIDIVLVNVKTFIQKEKDNKDLKEFIGETFTNLRKKQ
jgi:hypothetical protein